MPKKSCSLLLICFIGAEFFSQVGNQIAAVAIPILVLQFTHSAIATGIAGAGNIIPIVLAAFVGGKAIDQYKLSEQTTQYFTRACKLSCKPTCPAIL